MNMTPAFRKFALTSHITASVGWLGALAVFLAHAVASVLSQDVQMVRAASLAMELSAWFVILPLALASLISGLIQASGTPWGLFRHHWVLAKLLLTAFATVVLLLKLESISQLASAASETLFSRGDHIELRISLLAHAVGGLIVLLAVTTLAVYKPQGLTRFGVRKQREQDVAASEIYSSSTNTPKWVIVFWAVAAMLVLLLGTMLLSAGHGPGVHI